MGSRGSTVQPSPSQSVVDQDNVSTHSRNLSHDAERAHCDPIDQESRTDGDLQSTKFQHTWRIWTIFLVLCLLSFMSAVDATMITTALPTVTRDIGGAELYAWTANSFLFASTALQPLYGQTANIFGRRRLMLVALVLFALGSGLAGGCRDMAMLIAGRTIQGSGSAGLYVLSDIIICDLIPPRYRAPYLSAVIGTAALGTTIGPVIGGALAQVQWRWMFWINLPVAGVGLVATLGVLQVHHAPSPTWRQTLGRIDFVGNAIFIPSMVALFLGLLRGGVELSWGSWQIIIPLVVGVLGWVLFHVHQASRFCREPSMPPQLFKHRTSATGFVIIFLGAVVLQALSYFLPIYFQAVLAMSPLMSGVAFLPFALAIMPFGGAAGAIMAKTGRYIPLHWLGFALSAVAFGLLSMLTEASSTAAWVCFQIVAAGGVGIIFTVSLPSTLAPLPESLVAVATGTYSFVRSFGLVWGVTVASVIFNGRVDAGLGAVADERTRAALDSGTAYSLASGGFLTDLPAPIRLQVIHVYVDALRTIWLAVVGVSVVGFLAVFCEKHVELRKESTTDYGLVEENEDKSQTGQEKA